MILAIIIGVVVAVLGGIAFATLLCLLDDHPTAFFLILMALMGGFIGAAIYADSQAPQATAEISVQIGN